jgi:dolichol-phosphate mannosyltransferase
MYAQHSIGIVIKAGIDLESLKKTLETFPEYIDRIYAVQTVSGKELGSDAAVGSALQQDPRLTIFCGIEDYVLESVLGQTYQAAITDGVQVMVIHLGDTRLDPQILPHLLDPIVWGEADFTRGNRHVSLVNVKKRSPDPAYNSSIYISRVKLSSQIRELVDLPKGTFAVSQRGLELLEQNYRKDQSWKILVAIPCFNEALAIGSLILTVQRYVDDVLVVDDGSSDDTFKVAQGAGARVVRHKVNKGYGSALRTSFEYAQSQDYDVLIILDGDGQHDPADIPHLIKQMKATGADVVIGSRFLEKNYTMPLYRLVGMKLLDTMTRLTGKVDISDSQSGYRAYGRRAIDAITIADDAMGAGSEILTQIMEHNLKVAEVPIRVRYDLENTSSQHPLTHGIDVLDSLVWRVAGKRPFLFIGLPGFLLTVAGIFAGMLLIQGYTQTGLISILNVLLVVIVLLIGVLGLFIGLTMDMIGRVNMR